MSLFLRGLPAPMKLFSAFIYLFKSVRAADKARAARRGRIVTPLSFVFAALAWVASLPAQTTNGTWTNAATNSTWGTSTNWSGGAVAGGIDALADFSLDIAANRTVSLGASFTVGALRFEDKTTASNNWVLANGAGGPWALTLATSTGTPTIQVINQTATISAVLDGTQGFAKTGTGTLVISGANTLTGGITLAEGTLTVGSAAALNGNLITFTADATLGWSGNTLDVSPHIKIEDGVIATFGTGGASITFATALQTGEFGTAGLLKNGGGTLTLTAANTYTGLTRVRQGRLVLAGGDNRLAATGTIALGQAAQSGILQLGDASGAVNQTTTSIIVNGQGGTANAVVGGNSAASTLTVNNSAAVTFAGMLGGTGVNDNNLTLGKSGTGTLTISNAGNTFSGGVLLNQGTLSFATGALGTSGLITFASNSSLQWGTGNTTDVSPRLLVNDGVIGTLDTNGNNITLATALQTGPLGTGSLTKGGAGVLTLTAANTYTGNTRINNGRVVLAGGHDRLSAATLLQLGSGANSGVLQLGDASGPSNQTVAGISVTGNASSISNAVVGGNAAVSTLTVNNAGNVTYAQALGGTGIHENNLALGKTGTGTLTLSSAASTFIGDVTISAGTISLTNSNALGGGTKTISIVASASTPSLRLNNAGGIALPASFSLITNNDDVTNAAVVSFVGDNVIGGSIAPTVAVAGGTNGTRILVNANSLTLNGGIAPLAGDAASLGLILDGPGIGVANGVIADTGTRLLGVTKEGAGTWTLTAENSYTGATLVSAGRLNITTAQVGGGALTVADGATLGLSLAGAGQSLVASTITLGGVTGATLRVDTRSFSNPASALITTGTLTTAGTTTLHVSGTGLSVGQFGLIDYTGSIGGAGYAGLTLGTLPARVTGSLVDNVAASRVDLNITAFDVPKWTGTTNGSWDINDSADPTAGSGTVNWQETTSGLATRYLQFLGVVDSVRFDDSATGTTTVNLTTQLSPNSITVANSALAYTFSGSGHLSGSTTLLKQGSGSLTLANTGINDFSGTTTIEAGSLILGDGVSVGTGTFGTGNVVNHGQLVFNRVGDFIFANVISGTGGIIKQGAGALLLQGNNATYEGVITVGAGTLIVASANALGSTVGHTHVLAGAALDVTGRTTLAEALTLENGGRVKVTSGTNSKIDGPVTLSNGGIAEAAATTTLTLAGALSGTGGLVKEGAGTVIVTQATSYAGGTIIRGGTLQFGATTGGGTLAAPGLGSIDLAAAAGESATLGILRADNTLDISQTISSSGAGANSIIIGVGGAASLSGLVTFSGINTFSGNVSIVGGALRITNSSALGAGEKTVTIGNASQPGLLLDGSGGALVLAEEIRYAISSSGSGTAAGSTPGAIVNLAGDNTIHGSISVINGGGGNGKVYVQGGTLTLNGDIDAEGANGNRTIILGGIASGTVNGVISDNNSVAASVVGVTKSDAGTWTLTGSNSFTGSLTIQEGTLKVGTILSSSQEQPLSTGTAAISLGTTASATLEYTGGADATLERGITVGGTGGAVIHNSGGAVLTLSGLITRAASRPLFFTGGDFIVSGQITGAASVNHIDAATVTFSNTANSFLGSTHVFGGGVLRNGAAGVLTDTSTVVLGDALTNTGGTYDLNGFSETIAGLSSAGTGGKTVTNGAASGTATLTVGGAGTYDGVIRDGSTAQVALTKSSTGTLTLSGSTTYTGKTTISGGTLALSGATASLQSSPWVQVDSGATLDLSGVTGTYTQGAGTGARAISGAGTVNGSITLNGNVILSAGTSSDPQNIATAGDGLGTLTFNNDLTLLGGTTTLFQLGGATGNSPDTGVAANVLAFATTASAHVDHLNVAGTLTLHSGSAIHVTLSAYTPVSGDVFNLLDWGGINLNDFNLAVDLHLPALSDPLLSWGTDQFTTAGLLYITTSVPEPSRVLLLLGGLTTLLLRRRRSAA